MKNNKKKSNQINKKYYNLFFGIIIGLLLFNLLNPIEGNKPLIGYHLKIYLDKCYHIHHWIIFLFLHIYIISFYPNYKISFITGFLIGGIFNGLAFNDFLSLKC